MFLTSSTLWAYGAKNDSLVYIEVDKKVFLDQEKFFYFKKDLDLTMSLKKRKDVNSITGVLLATTDNNNLTSTLILDWERGRNYTDIVLLSRERVSKFTFENTELFNDSVATSVHFYANVKQDSAMLVLAGDTVHMGGMGFTIKNGYKFSVLPILSVSPEPNVLPVLTIQQINISVAKRSFFESTWYWYVLIIVVDLLIFLWIHLRRKRKKKLIAERTTAYAEGRSENQLQQIELPHKSAIYLFGNFQVYDKDGEDITKRFSPLLKEMLTVLIIHSSQKGISSDKLNELFWFDKDRVSAKNNRAVNIGKLRSLLNLVGDFELSNDTGYWLFDSNTIFTDYIQFSKRFFNADILQKEDVEMLMALSKRGNLLPDTDYAWLDSYKSNISNLVLDHFWKYANSLNFEKAAELIIDIADRILLFEHINEQALYLKCKALSLSGRHSSAKKVYDKFRLDYEAVYGVPFRTAFTTLLEKTSWD
ncbi:hypothetical protein [Bacteroides sp. 51]|uniref:hypothetical protein n=1 Tax=Bacteroides sp. 51 TaxID=2302938 RepID=UPI0013D66945|nr:hypothetical protein [Bacteroides sp. 51]NDV80711.1 hypothetical protein [Bacteroides sp. 51]